MCPNSKSDTMILRADGNALCVRETQIASVCHTTNDGECWEEEETSLKELKKQHKHLFSILSMFWTGHRCKHMMPNHSYE